MFENLDYGSLTGIVILPGDPRYESARQEYNRAIQKYPLAIVYCLAHADVQNAVKWCRETGVGLRIRSGGHNYEGYSTGNAVLVADLSRLTAVRLDRCSCTLTVQGGAQNRHIYAALAQSGLHFPGGSCLGVGVTGYASGGGWGFFCRHLGLGCDSLVELKLVNYRGNLLTANRKRNPNLFWACRGGGGGNFGIVVSMTFSLPPMLGKVTYFTLHREDATARMQQRFLSTWQRWLPGLDTRMTLRPSLLRSASEGRSIFSRGIFFGRPGEAAALLRPLIGSAGLELHTHYMSFAAATAILGSVYPESEMFKSTGRFVTSRLSAHEIQRIVGLLDKIPEGLDMLELGLFALGGEVSRVPPGSTAYYFRDAHYILGMQTMWSDPQAAEIGSEWVDRAFDIIAPLTAGSYVNFPYDCMDDYEIAYYGGNVDRLRAVKRAYDPENVFHYPQSIRA